MSMMTAATYNNYREIINGAWEYSPLEGGHEYYLGRLENDPFDFDNKMELWEELCHAGGSDYSGGDCTRANYDYMREHFSDHADVCFYYGGHGTYGVLIRKNTEDAEIKDIIAGLEDYPVIDDDKLTEVCGEWEQEAWANNVSWDFQKGLIKKFEDLEEWIENIPDDKLLTFFHASANNANVYWEYEHSGAYIDVDKVIADVTLDDIAGLLAEILEAGDK